LAYENSVLIGVGGQELPTDLRGVIAPAAELMPAHITAALRAAEPLGGVSARHYRRKCVAPLRQVGRFPKGLLVIAKAVPSSTRDGSMGDETYPSERGHGTLSHSSSATSAVQW